MKNTLVAVLMMVSSVSAFAGSSKAAMRHSAAIDEQIEAAQEQAEEDQGQDDDSACDEECEQGDDGIEDLQALDIRMHASK